MSYNDNVSDHLFRFAFIIVVVTVAIMTISTLTEAGGDVNLDGAFTFNDVGRAALMAYCAPGTWLLNVLPGMAEFLDYNWYQGIGWQLLVTSTLLWMGIILAIMWSLYMLIARVVGRSSRP